MIDLHGAAKRSGYAYSWAFRLIIFTDPTPLKFSIVFVSVIIRSFAKTSKTWRSALRCCRTVTQRTSRPPNDARIGIHRVFMAHPLLSDFREYMK